jgi:RNA polymerase sigma-70 factor (ECF subfamily)
LLRIAHGILRDWDQAEDVVAETFLKAWVHRDRLRTPDKLQAWLARICRNESLSIIRQRKHRDTLSLAPEELEQIAAVPEQPPLLRHTADLLDQLPRELKICAEMFFFDGHSYSQIAGAIGLPLSTVRGRIYQSRRHLAKEIEMTRERSAVNGGQEMEVITPRDKTIRWQGCRIRLLGLSWTGSKRLYDGQGKRLSRVPTILQRSPVFLDPLANESIARSEHKLSVFFELAGDADVMMVADLEGASTGKLALPRRQECEEHDGKRVVCLLAGALPEADREARLQGKLVGCEDTARGFRFVPTGLNDTGWVCVSGADLGAFFLTDRRAGPRKGTCTFTVAFSAGSMEEGCRIYAIDRSGKDIEPASASGGWASSPRGHLHVTTLDVNIPPEDVAGAAIYPRHMVRADWGKVRLPPSMAATP